MPQRAALLIAVETFFEAAPPIAYAAADAAELLRILPSVGYNSEKCLLLAGTRTTKASIESYLHQLPKLFGKVDSLLVMIVSRAFRQKARGYLVCADSIVPDLPGTSLALADLLAALHKVRTSDVTILFDLEPLTLPGESEPSGLDEAELTQRFDDSPSCVGLFATAPGERSFESAQLRHGIWRHHLLEALTGKARSGVDSQGNLTAAGLQAYLADAVPRTLRRTYETSQEQRPLLFGHNHAGNMVAELGSVLHGGGELLDPARMKRVVFRAESISKVRELSGFRKNHSLPDRVNDWARKYVNRAAQPDIKTDLDGVFDMIREQFGYKRKDLDVSAERDGLGFIRTPDFEYTITVNLNPEDPTEVVWRRELSRLSDPAFVRSTAFQAVFGPLCERLVFEFAVPVDIADFVDRIEDAAPEGVKVNVASTLDSAEIRLAGFTGRVTVTRDSAQIEGRSGSSAGLLDQFLEFLRKFAGVGEPKALTG